MEIGVGTSAVDRLHAALDGVLADGGAGLDDDGLRHAVVELHRAEARLVAARSALVAELDRRAAYRVSGAASAGAWVAHSCGLPGGTARDQVRVAHALADLPAVAGGLGSGTLSAPQGLRLARLWGNERVRAALVRDEAHLVGLAGRLVWAGFDKAVAYWAQLADEDGCEADAEARRARRRCTRSRTLDDMWKLDALLDPIGGATVDAALATIEDELYEHDRRSARDRLRRDPLPFEVDGVRSRDQRRADALVDLAERAMASPVGGRRPEPLVTVLVGFETFAGRVCELADGTVLAPGDVAALLDRAVVERVVFDGPARVLDVGERRLFTGALRRAIQVRDRTCTHHHCDRPADRCDVDHIVPAEHGGPTTQDNGRLLCPFHNHLRQQHPVRRRTTTRRRARAPARGP